jgi:hypothetical protein
MLKQKSLADIIQEKIPLGKISNTGFYNLRCAVCADHSERGGFKFDGDTSYSCWNCQARFRYEEGSGKLSRNAKQVLAAFGITSDDLLELTSPIFLPQKEITLEALTKVKLTTPEVSFPDRTYPLLSEGREELQAPLLEYLLSRKIDPVQQQLYFSLDPKLLRRVIIPIYRDQKLIFWQARTIDDVRPRYRSCPVAKDAVLYGFNELHSYEPTPLFVTEGIFDALLINGISTLGSSLTPAKIELLKRTKRRLIFVIDRDHNGGELGRTAIENGWEVTFVDLRASDINDSVIRFGLPYTAYSLIRNTTRDKNVLELELMEARLRGM